ncbi:bucentaur or craniofacial development-domain-containing protein [Mycena amicta]|nr:bucentaur or craniofacial development-domain-containing protein [Mycena amicta]
MSQSDSEDDSDFVPPVADAESSSDEEAQPDLKRARTASPPKQTEDEKKEARKALWQTFLADEPAESSASATPKKLVKIEKRYLFAGEETVEVVQVPEDSPEATKWPLWRPPEASDPSLPPSTTANTAKRKPGPRKPKTTLAAIPTTRPRKLSTLDKSTLDWKTHVAGATSDVQEELDANRRGGGYLEKVEFLNRVEARKEDALEASRTSKRRR